MSFSVRRAKIVATVGPASSEVPILESLIKAGVDVFRLNFSHGTHADHLTRIQNIRKASAHLKKYVAILQDLQGPKLRVGRFANGSTQLEKGAEVLLRLEDRDSVMTQTQSGPMLIPYNYEPLAREIRTGHRILMDDGNLEIVVTAIDDKGIHAQVIFGGTLKDHKGMNFPDTKLSIQSFTQKDKEDLLFGLTHDVDYVALSFVRTADDVRNVKKFMHSHKKNVPVVSKIEKGDAIDNLRDIIDITDAVMIARGDLAVEVGTQKVPALQKEITRMANARGIPVITATQMLESMISTPRPTRAEASDVANAVLDGSDALMLSAESASGKFPVLAVSVMQNIILETEQRRISLIGESQPRMPGPDATIVDAVEYAAAGLVRALGAKTIVCITHSGESALALSQHRPDAPIVALTDNEVVARRLALVWGVQTEVFSKEETALQSVEEVMELMEQRLVTKGMLDRGDLVVCTAGSPPLKHGSTNFIKVIRVRHAQADNPKGTPEEDITGYRTRKAQFVLDHNLCTQCGGCVEVCPNDILGIEKRRVFLKEANCKSCVFDNACVEICPTGAIEIIRLGD